MRILFVLALSSVWQGRAFDCGVFNCTCQGFVDYYGADYHQTYGCAPREAQTWSIAQKCDAECEQKGTGCKPSSEDYRGCELDCTPFGCTCQGFSDWYGSETGKTWGCATTALAQTWWTAHKCEGPGVDPIKPSVVPGTRRGGCKCISDTAAGLHKFVPCKALWPLGTGFSVTYNVPEKCLTEKCGLIVDVHGYTMDGDAQDSNTNMRALGEENGFVVVQPNAPGWGWHKFANWNTDAYSSACSALNPDNSSLTPQTCWNAPWQEEPAGDRAIYTWLQEALSIKEWNIDANRVHFMGFSEGGWMTGRMLCNYPHVFASFVMLAGASNDDPFACIQPGAPQPPVLINQGYNDYSSTWRAFNTGFKGLVTKWKLGPGKVVDGKASCGQEWETFDCNNFNCTCQGFADWYGSVGGRSFGCATTATAVKWAQSNACRATATPGAFKGGCEGCFSRTTYAGPTGVPLDILAFDYVADYGSKGHCFPGGDPYKVGHGYFAMGCPGVAERAAGAKWGYNISDEAMRWFLAHPKKGSLTTVLV